MKLRNIALNGLFNFFYLFGASVVVMLAEALLIKILVLFAEFSFPVLTVIRAVVYTLGIAAIIGVIAYYEGYREGACSVPETIGGGLFAMVPHVLFSLLFSFQAFVSGGVRYVAGMLYNGIHLTYEQLEATPTWVMLLVFLFYGLLYTTVITMAHYLGANRRIISRAELRKNEVSPADEMTTPPDLDHDQP